MLKIESKSWVAPAAIVSSILILALDAATAKGNADYIFYFIPVALAVFHSSTRFPVFIALLCTVLSLAGFQLSPGSSVNITQAFVNRAYAIFAFWVVSLLVRQIIASRNKVEANSWIRNSASDLAAEIRGEQTSQEIAERILRFLTVKLDFKVGAIFLRKNNAANFKFIAGYAYTPDSEKNYIVPGQGLLGQIALDKKMKYISSVPEEHLKISSALGESKTTHLVLLPLVADNETLGLVELGFLKEPQEAGLEFLQLISESTAISIRSAEARAKISTLLEETQKYAEELQTQQEELRVTNEELEQQSKALKDSHARLENQQAELEQTNQQLEEQAQELEQQKNLLNQKNQELEVKTNEIRRSSNYKSEFLANMSHELRTPLNSSLILAKLLIDNKPGNLTKEQIEYAEIIYNSGNDLLNLINDILDLSKVEAGKMTINPEVVLIEVVMKHIEQTFRPIATQKQLDFKIHIDENVPHEMITDRQRLEQILKNFLSNAFKFTHEGGVSLHVFVKDNEVSFAVADTGVGMEPDEQNIIFEAFRQADGTTNRKYGGTGLGLSISKELSHVLGGDIVLASTKGQGSTFTLTLPLVFKEDAAPKRPSPQKTIPQRKPEPATSPLPQSQSSVFSFKDDRDQLQKFTKRMLIIEDDETFAKILMDVAHEMNFGAIVASTGDEGLQCARTLQPNAIVLDIRLPDHSGMIVLDQLKMNTKTRHIPVHVMSSEDFSRSALEMGAIGYMIKPVMKDQLQVAFQNITSMMEQEMKRVLIVEDDPVQRKHIAQLIGDKKVEVTTVETSAAALEELSKKTFDCMIMDLSLPDMSGHELLSRLSNDTETYSFPPVIVYTARDLTPEEEEKLRLYSGSIIIKGAKSPERLLSEVTLFLHKVETELPPERQKMLKDLRSREKNLEGRKILIVDDDVRNIFALTASLETHGAQIISARNGREAIEKMSLSVDLVLMDIMMPEMDGYEAMTKIRKIDDFRDIPIIALTAKAMKDDKQKCLDAGANDYLSKPIQMDKLLSLIRVWLPQKRRFS